MSGIRVQLEDVRRAFERTMQGVEAEFGDRIELHGDFYWHLPIESAFMIATEPTAVTARHVTDDVTALTMQDSEDLPPPSVRENLEDLVGVLRALEWQLHTSGSAI